MLLEQNDLVYILFGGGGFMGQGLRHLLDEYNNQVIIIGRKASIICSKNEQYFSLEQFSLNEIAKRIPTDKKIVIVDLAYTSVPNTSFEDPVKDFSENLYNVNKNLGFALQIKAHKYIYFSSGGTVYGNISETLIPETAANFPLSPYGITKMACERYVNMYHQIEGLNTVIVRPSNIYGPGQIPFRGQGFIATALGKVIKKEPITIFGNGDAIRDYLYISDFCTAIMDIICFAAGGSIYNIGYGEGASITTLLKCIDHLLDKEHLHLNVNYLPLRPYDVSRNVLDCTRIHALNGWRPTVTLENGLIKTWHWIQTYLPQTL